MGRVGREAKKILCALFKIDFFFWHFLLLSIFNNCDLYLCDLFGIWSACLQDFHLLVHIGTVHPFCSSCFFVRLVEASKQSSKWTEKQN